MLTVRNAVFAAGVFLAQVAVPSASEVSSLAGTEEKEAISAGISVAQAKSHGACPRILGVKAAVQMNDVVANEAPLRYRFLENGQPVTRWRTIVPGPSKTVHLRHQIEVTSSPDALRTPKAVAKEGTDQTALGHPSGVRQKSTVGIEVQVGTASASDLALYRATCIDTGQAALQPSFDQQLPDLTAAGGVRLGGTFIPWGGSATLSADDIIAAGPQGCTVRFAFDVVNAGSAPAPTHGVRLQRGVRTLSLLQSPPIKAERKRTLGGHIQVPSGQSTLRLRIDPTRTVREANEANNLASIRLTAPAQCRITAPGRP